MGSTFSISLLCESPDRPPLSHKVTDYLVQFIIEKVLAPKNIILSTEWSVEIAMMFMPAGESGPSAVDVYQPDIFEDLKLKAYPVVIPLKAIQEAQEPYLKTIELMYEGLFIFFTAHYKEVTAHFMQDLWEQVDFDYLFSLPYPADITEQQYVGD